MPHTKQRLKPDFKKLNKKRLFGCSIFPSLGGGGANGGSYLQLTDRSAALWEDSPNEFVEEEEGEEEDGRGVTAGGTRSAGLSLIRDLCNTFPEKVLLVSFFYLLGVLVALERVY